MRISFSPPYIDDNVINEVVDSLKSGWITTGPKVKALEEEIGKISGVKMFYALIRGPQVPSSCSDGWDCNQEMKSLFLHIPILLQPWQYYGLEVNLSWLTLQKISIFLLKE